MILMDDMIGLLLENQIKVVSEENLNYDEANNGCFWVPVSLMCLPSKTSDTTRYQHISASHHFSSDIWILNVKTLNF